MGGSGGGRPRRELARLVDHVAASQRPGHASELVGRCAGDDVGVAPGQQANASHRGEYAEASFDSLSATWKNTPRTCVTGVLLMKEMEVTISLSPLSERA